MGIYVEGTNDKNELFNFIQNSDIFYIGKGSYGHIVRLTINNSDFIPKYKYMKYGKFGNSVNSIILKISYIKTKSATSIRVIDENDFNREVNIQTDIFLKTMKYMKPLCPAIIYADIFNESDKYILNNILNVNISEDLPNIEEFSLIAMELAEEYITIHNYLNENNLKDIDKMSDEPIARINENVLRIYSLKYFGILQLLIETGYSHHDFHNNNVMIDNSPEPNSIILIDFGETQKLQPEKIKEIRDECANKKYFDAMSILCDIPRYDEKDLRTYPQLYGDVCDANIIYDEKYEQKITDYIDFFLLNMKIL